MIVNDIHTNDTLNNSESNATLDYYSLSWAQSICKNMGLSILKLKQSKCY